MRTVTKRDLNQHTATVLDQVTDADDLVVTERGRPRWRVTAYRDQDSRLAGLERAGRYSPPAVAPAPWPSQPGGPKYSTGDVDALLDELRGDH